MGADSLSIRSCSPVRRGAGSREIAAIAILAALAVALAWFLVAADMRSDASALGPLGNRAGLPTVLIGRPELRDRQKRSEFNQNLPPADTRVQMLGYMMEGGPPSTEGEEIRTFILMPSAGQMLRAARRDPDDMIEVRLRRPARFRKRELVWVSGRIEHSTRTSGGIPAASHVMRDSEVVPAEQRDITRWFAP